MKPHLLWATLCLTLSLPALQAQPENTPKAPAQDWAWTTREWKDDNKPYAAIRSGLNSMARQKALSDAVVAQYKAAYLKKPFNPVALYRWAFAAYHRENDSPSRGGARLQGLLNGFERVEEFKPVSAYDFVRLKFILTARDYPVQPLRPLGERLLKRDPKDYFVKLALTPILWEDDPVQGPLKRRYIAEMMQYAPKDSRPRQMLARMAFNKWYFAKDRKGPEAAIAEIRRLENLEPKLPQFQRYAEYQIQLMQRIQSRRQAAASQTKEAAH